MFLFCAPTKLKITFLFLNQKLPKVVEFLRYFAALFAHQGKQILRLTPSPVSTKNKKQESWNNPPKFWDLNDAWLKDHHVDIRRRKKVIEPQRQNCQRHVCFPVEFSPASYVFSNEDTESHDHFILMKWGLLQRSRTETWSSTFLATVINNSTIWNISKREGFTHDLRQINAQASLFGN